MIIFTDRGGNLLAYARTFTQYMAFVTACNTAGLDYRTRQTRHPLHH